MDAERQRQIFVKPWLTQYTYPYGEMMNFYIHSMISQKVMHLAKIC